MTTEQAPRDDLSARILALTPNVPCDMHGRDATLYRQGLRSALRAAAELVAADRALVASQAQPAAEPVACPIGIAPKASMFCSAGYCDVCVARRAATPQQPAAAEPGDMLWCETCEGLGTIDETLGGYSFSNPKADCPDCNGNGWWRRKVQQPAAASAGASDDTRRMDWLVRQVVNVRTPMRYGSMQRFLAVPDDDDGGNAQPFSDLRARIDAALQSPPVATAQQNEAHE